METNTNTMQTMAFCRKRIIPNFIDCARPHVWHATYWIVTIVLPTVGFHNAAFGQESRNSKAIPAPEAKDDRATQRWLPVDRRKLGELGRLGELLGDPQSPEESIGKADDSQSKSSTPIRNLPFDLSKVDVRSLEERLANLTPEQRERVKKLASQLSKNDSWKDISAALKDLPPSLVDQMRESPSLREFAKDVLENEQADAPNTPSNDISLDEDEQPWIKFDPSNSSLKTQAEDQSDKRSSAAPTTSIPQTAESDKGAKNQSQGRNEPSIESTPPPLSSDRDRRSRVDTAPSERNRLNPAGQDRVNRINVPRNSQDVRARNGDKNSQSSRGESTARPSAAGSSRPTSKPETAFESLRRRVSELGLGQTFEKLAKEAVGIEKSRDQEKASQNQTTTANAEKVSSTKGNAKNSKTDPKTKNMPTDVARRESETAPPTPNEPYTANRDDSNRLDYNRANQQSVPSKATSTNTESVDALSSWRAPSWDDLPSISSWHLFAVLSIVLIVSGLLWLNRRPGGIQNATQRRRDEAQKAKLLEMEIVNREHVVLAFDTVVTKQLRSLEEWWTSQRVVKHVVDRQLNYSANLQAAEVVYKSARYSPPEKELTQDELTTVREAIRECLKSRDTE